MSTKYDFIITGAGCAGLSLAVHLHQAGLLRNKQLLIFEKERKQANDKTWCFWEKNSGVFEPVVSKTWSHANFISSQYSTVLDLYPYEYKMIRGIDYSDHCYQILENSANIKFIYGSIKSIDSTTGIVHINNENYTADYIFNSIQFSPIHLAPKNVYLKQHFKGWMLETNTPAFTPDRLTLMDFRLDQQNSTRFFYILPISEKKALIEFTVFSEHLMEHSQYTDALTNYIKGVLNIQEYKILEEEYGCIPMTDYLFPSLDGRVLNIGTAGGVTRGSTGYTFYFIQKHSAAIVDALLNKKPLPRGISSRMVNFLDSIFLRVLAKENARGEEIFSSFFKKNSAANVLEFLNGETTMLANLKIISSLPSVPFLKASIIGHLPKYR